MNPWTIIGWLLLLIFVIIPIGLWLLRSYHLNRLWKEQAKIRTQHPKKYQIWKSFKTNECYYINSDVNGLNNSVMISTVANNQGGSYYKLNEWDRLVRTKKLILT